ncbi:MAG TPA: hypothetical protein VGG10_18190 [Rhizomicrobium sp.]|jgi:hypothetical protein
MQHFPPPRQPDPYGTAVSGLVLGVLAVVAFAAGALFSEWLIGFNRRRPSLRHFRESEPVIRFATPAASEEFPQENV